MSDFKVAQDETTVLVKALVETLGLKDEFTSYYAEHNTMTQEITIKAIFRVPSVIYATTNKPVMRFAHHVQTKVLQSPLVKNEVEFLKKQLEEALAKILELENGGTL